MPFRRKRNGRKKTRVSAPVKRFVKNAITRFHETKQYTLGAINTTVGTYAAVASLDYDLTQIAQGSGASDRDGNLIMITGFYARFVVTYSDATNIVRFLLWQSKDNSGATSNLEVNSPHDQDKVKLFKDVLATVGSSGPMTKTVVIKKKFKKPYRYYGANGTDRVSAPIVFSVVSDSGAASHPGINGHFRLYWKDN